MEEVNQLTKIIIAWELFEQDIPKSHIASKLGLNRETVHIWINEILKVGLTQFLEDYINAKKGERAKRKTDGLLKARIYKLREENRDCCGQKIKEFLEGDYGVSVSTTTIYKVLGERYQLRSKWKHNQMRGSVPEASKPREVIQMDTVDFGAVFAFTGVDIFAKDAVVKLYPTLTSLDGANFLESAFEEKFNHTDLLQADGGPEFKDEFRKRVLKFADRFRIARPYKKNEQSYIESFNRSLRKECLGWSKYKPVDIPYLEKELNEYLWYYHNRRPHMSLGMKTPNQFLKEVSDF
jgi:transposase InsO family protein